MWKMFGIAAVVASMSATAEAMVLTFDDLAPGTQVTDFNFGPGLTGEISAVGVNSNSPNAAVVFNTDVLTPNSSEDPDLESPFSLAGSSDVPQDRSFGNALIVQENPAVNGVFLPDDDGRGGSIAFAFDSLISLDSVFLLDTVVGASVTLLKGGDTVSVLSTIFNADTNNATRPNLYTFVDFEGAIGDEFIVNFNGKSGAIGEIQVSAVPLPATLPLLLGAIGAFGLFRRYASKQSV